MMLELWARHFLDGAQPAIAPSRSAEEVAPWREPIGVLHVVDCLNVGGTERQLFELIAPPRSRALSPAARLLQSRAASSPRSCARSASSLMVFPLRGSLAQAEHRVPGGAHGRC